MADRVDVSLFLDSHHDAIVVGRCPLGGPTYLALLVQDGVPGYEEHVSPLILVHRLVPSFSQPHALLNPSSFLLFNVIVVGIQKEVDVYTVSHSADDDC